MPRFKPGNPGKPIGAVSHKPVKDTLVKLLAEASRTGKGTKLDDLAATLFRLAEEGDVVAIREIINRVDGLPRQELVGDGGGPLQVIVQRFTAE